WRRRWRRPTQRRRGRQRRRAQRHRVDARVGALPDHRQGLALALRGGLRAGERAVSLSKGSLAAARAIAEGLFCDEAGPPPRERLDYWERELADFFGNVTLRASLIFGAAIVALSWLAPLLILRLPPMSRLEPQARAQAITAAEHSLLSLAVLATKAILCIL